MRIAPVRRCILLITAALLAACAAPVPPPGTPADAPAAAVVDLPTAVARSAGPPLVVTTAVPGAPPTDGYNQLKELRLVDPAGTPGFGGWAGAGMGLAIETENGLLPRDTAEQPGDAPTIRIAVDGSAGWWTGSLALPGWNTYSVAPYMANGVIAFAIKGQNGDENPTISFTGKGAGGIVLESIKVELNRYAQPTTDWTTVEIPLRDLLAAGGAGFSPSQVLELRFSGVLPATFWIADLRISSPDSEPSFPAIKINQVGYQADAEKYALVSGWRETLDCANAPFVVRRAADSAPMIEGTLTLINDFDALVSGERICLADFGALREPGTYTLAVDGLDPSPRFDVSATVYAPLLRDATRYFYMQRQGIAIEDPVFARGVGHPDNDARAVLRSSCSDDSCRNATLPARNVSGGWYDAGDYGKYVAFAAAPIRDLLDAHARAPALFGDDTGIAESGNGVPDILDEVRWKLDWILRMQEPTTGGFHNSIYPNNCIDDAPCAPGSISAAVAQRYITDLGDDGTSSVQPTPATATAVAALARAARAFAPIDDAYATRLRAAALRGQAYLDANPGVILPKDGNARYTDDEERQFRLWALAELFHTTGDAAIGAQFLTRYGDEDRTHWDPTRNLVTISQHAALSYFSAPAADAAAREAFVREQFGPWRDYWLAASTTNWRNFLKDGSSGDSSYYWGSNAVALEYANIMLRGSTLAGDDPAEAQRAARGVINYVLGINPLAKSYVTGYGSNPPTKIYSHIYSHDAHDGLPAGILAEGPNQFQGAFYSRFYGKAYADTDSDWTVSEHAIYYNARLVLTLAGVLGEGP